MEALIRVCTHPAFFCIYPVFFHQMIYINPTTRTVIVKNSANPRYLNYANVYANELVTLALFREIAR